jgi:hypothetical protein
VSECTTDASVDGNVDVCVDTPDSLDGLESD